MLSIGTVVMGVGDLHRAVAFWTQALDYVPKRALVADDDDTEGNRFCVIDTSHG